MCSSVVALLAVLSSCGPGGRIHALVALPPLPVARACGDAAAVSPPPAIKEGQIVIRFQFADVANPFGQFDWNRPVWQPIKERGYHPRRSTWQAIYDKWAARMHIGVWEDDLDNFLQPFYAPQRTDLEGTPLTTCLTIRRPTTDLLSDINDQFHQMHSLRREADTRDFPLQVTVTGIDVTVDTSTRSDLRVEIGTVPTGCILMQPVAAPDPIPEQPAKPSEPVHFELPWRGSE